MVQIVKQKDDPVFPQINDILDVEKMKEVFQAELIPEVLQKHYRIQKVKVDRFQYKPGKKCRLNYHLTLYDPHEPDRENSEILTCQVLPAGVKQPKSPNGFSWFREKDKLAPRYFIQNLNLDCLVFPNDFRLKHLWKVLSADYLQSLFQEIFPGWKGQIEESEYQIVKYVPADRCVFSVKLRINGDAGKKIFYLKTYADPPNHIYQALIELNRHSKEKGLPVLLPNPIHFDKNTGTIVVEELLGTKLTEVLGEVGNKTIGKQAADLLATLHTSSIEDLHNWQIRDEFENLFKAVKIISKWDKTYDGDLWHLTSRLKNIPQSEPEFQTPIHGAFRATQMMRVGDKMALLDFDGLLLGDPLYDISSFISHLLYLTVKQDLTLEDAKEITEIFLEHYRNETHYPLAEDRLRWYTASILISKHGKKIIKRGKKDNLRKIQALLHLSDEIINGGLF